MKIVEMSSAKSILLSVVIPISRMAGRLQNLEKSLNSCINGAIEILIVHDVQDEDTENDLRNLKERYPSESVKLEFGKWGNPGEARNLGLTMSSGEWIIFWDADDIGYASQVIDAINEADANESYIVGQFDTLDYRENKIIHFSAETQNLNMLAMNPGLWRIAMRREKVRMNKFLPLRMAEDQIFIAELAMTDSNTKFSEKKFYTYCRNFPNQLTSQQPALLDLRNAITATREVARSNWTMSNDLSVIMLFRQRLTLGKHLISYSPKLFLQFLYRTLTEIFVEPKVKAVKAMGFIVSSELRKRRNQKRTVNFVVLTGGLGNQLFQLSGALGLGSGKVIAIDCVGRPRAQNGTADIFDLDLPYRVVKHSCKKSPKYLNRLFNLHLSLGLRERAYLGSPIVKRFLELTTNLLFSIHLRKRIKILVSSGVGYDPSIKSSGKNLLIGYFQSYKWSEPLQVFSELNQIRLSKAQNMPVEFGADTDTKPVLVVHIRLGDYRYEKDFGTLQASYYQKAINLVKAEMGIGVIWLFSDEPDFAIQLIPDEFRNLTRIIRDDGKSPAFTLELMRRGNAYVIANSSFSWWGAKLSYQESPIVVAPIVWFAGAPEPVDLIPPSWYRA